MGIVIGIILVVGVIYLRKYIDDKRKAKANKSDVQNTGGGGIKLPPVPPHNPDNPTPDGD